MPNGQTSLSVSSPTQIVGGQTVDAQSGESRLAVLLLITRSDRLSACTGAVINSKFVLTAAHCVAGVPPANVKVFFRTRVDEPPPRGPEIQAAKIVVHRLYDGTAKSLADIALVQLTDSAPAQYQASHLFGQEDKVADDQVLLIGYGITGERARDSMLLRKTIKSWKSDLEKRDDLIGVNQSSPSGGFCRGDSGAPIYVQTSQGRKLFGINSFTVGLEKNKECHTASVALPVARFADWIKNHANL